MRLARLLSIQLLVATALVAAAVTGPMPASATALAKGGGTVSCFTDITITFKPPMTAGNGSSVKGAVKFTATSCSGGVPTPTKVVGRGRVSNFSFDMCNGNQSAIESSLTMRLTYPHQHLSASHLVGSWGGSATPGAFETDFVGSVTGSYPSSSMVADADFSTDNYTGSCAAGIRSVWMSAGISNL